jgi:hypothetical protein
VVLLLLPRVTVTELGMDMVLLLLLWRAVTELGIDMVLLVPWRPLRDMGIRLAKNPGAASRFNPSDVSMRPWRGRYLVNSVQKW